MEAASSQVLLNLVANIGIGGIFVFLYFHQDRKLTEKDKQLADMNKDLLQAYTKNTEVSQAVKASIEKNTEATEGLTQKVYDIIIRNGNGNGVR